MKRISKLNSFYLILLFVIIPFNSLQAQQRPEEPGSEETIMVGRISHLEGRVLRYVPEKDDWVAAVQDAPFGMDDALHSGEHGRGEFILPNNTWIRIDGDTQIQVIVLKEDITGIDIASGIARFYNKGSNAVIKATTPFGYVTAPTETCFDLYVGDDSVEVISQKGKIEFVHYPDEKKFEVFAGSASIVADSRQTTAGEGYGTPDWENWNGIRDNIWEKRLERKGESAEHLPPALNHDAWVLDEYGRWVRVYYEGAYRYFWRPVHVGIDWSPFSVGRWTSWYGDPCWIPAERFGYVTHHYGNWVLVKGIWYWTPPVVRADINLGPPFFNIGINRYRYFKRAVIINRENLHRVNNYKRIRTTNNVNVITKYRAAPAINNRIIGNYTKIRKKYDFKNVNPTRKPHRIVTKKIHQNKLETKMNSAVRAKTVSKTPKKIRHRNLAEGAKIKKLKVKSRLVPTDQANRPVSKVNFRERDLRRAESGRLHQKVRAAGGKR